MPIDQLIAFDAMRATIEAVTEFRSLHRWSYAIAPLIATIVAGALGWSKRVTSTLALLAAGLVMWLGYGHVQESLARVPVAREAAQEENAALLAKYFDVSVDPHETSCLQTLIDLPAGRCTIPSATGDATYVFTVTGGQLNLERVGPPPLLP